MIMLTYRTKIARTAVTPQARKGAEKLVAVQEARFPHIVENIFIWIGVLKVRSRSDISVRFIFLLEWSVLEVGRPDISSLYTKLKLEAWPKCASSPL